MNMKMSDVKLIVYDFDGVMTNNKVIVDQFGNESVIVNRSDGYAVSYFRKKNIKQLIISTEENPVVQKRAEKLKIECLQGIHDKKSILKAYLDKNKIDKEKVIYIGNEINDLEVMKFVGIAIAPSDADWRIKEIAQVITKANGGDGVVRELMDLIKADD